LSRPTWRLLRLRDERRPERSFRAFAAEPEVDVNPSGWVAEDGDGGSKQLGEAVRVGEIQGIAHRCLASVVRAEEHREAARERARQITAGAGSESSHCDRAQVHGSAHPDPSQAEAELILLFDGVHSAHVPSSRSLSFIPSPPARRLRAAEVITNHSILL
jgi:hypothetical protein